MRKLSRAPRQWQGATEAIASVASVKYQACYNMYLTIAYSGLLLTSLTRSEFLNDLNISTSSLKSLSGDILFLNLSREWACLLVYWRTQSFSFFSE